MFGDWREEVLLESTDGTAMRIYTTTIPTEKRIYTLMHDPEYRNSMCEKGYQQSHMADFYLGDGMAEPPKPNIKYPDGTGGGPVGTGGAGGGGNTGAGGSGGIGSSDDGGSTGPAIDGDGGAIGSAGARPSTGGRSAAGGGGNSGSALGAGGTPATGGSASATSGAAGGQNGTGAPIVASDAGCSCSLGSATNGTSAGSLLAILGVLGLALHRRRSRR
jgi:MYXO-CTERM domain-containing protein